MQSHLRYDNLLGFTFLDVPYFLKLIFVFPSGVGAWVNFLSSNLFTVSCLKDLNLQNINLGVQT